MNLIRLISVLAAASGAVLSATGLYLVWAAPVSSVDAFTFISLSLVLAAASTAVFLTYRQSSFTSALLVTLVLIALVQQVQVTARLAAAGAANQAQPISTPEQVPAAPSR